MTPQPALACPVCATPNECAAARGGDHAAPCWCVAVAPDPTVLAALPADMVGQACLCRRCLGDSAFVRQRLADRAAR